ncbi:MAG: penicillin-insensitive murein endopeptidase, partial [Miltoncostaeaceae bacterium]
RDVAERPTTTAPMGEEPLVWRDSRALGVPWDGALRQGVRLPESGDHHITWDPVRREVGNRPGRRWATDDTIRATLAVAAAHRAAHPDAPPMTVGDLSRRTGGDFGVRFGAPGHASHQNGRDVDVYYPRDDGREAAPDHVGQVDRKLAQDLVDRFLARGAAVVFVSRETGLTGPPGRLQYIPHHDTHLHARFGPDRGP